MRSHFGSWTTAIHDHSQAQLASFWKRRFKALESADAAAPANWLSSVVVVGVAIMGSSLPTLLAQSPEPAARPATQIRGAASDEQDSLLKKFAAGRVERLKLLAKSDDPNAPERLRRPDVDRRGSVDFAFGQPIRSAFEFLSDVYRVHIVLPPGDFDEQRLTFQFSDKTLAEQLDIFCEHAGWEWDTDGYVIYAGPEPAVKQFRRLVATRDERRRICPPGIARRLQNRVEVEFFKQPLDASLRWLAAATSVTIGAVDPDLSAVQITFSSSRTGSLPLPLDVTLDLLSLKYDLKWHIDDTGTVIVAQKPAEQARLQDTPEYIVLEEIGLEIEDIEFQGEPLQDVPGAMIVPVELEPLNGRTLDPIVPIEEQPLPILKRFEHAADHPVAIT